MKKISDVLKVLDFLNLEQIQEILNALSEYNFSHHEDKLIIKLVLKHGLTLATLQKIHYSNKTNHKILLNCELELTNLDKSTFDLYINNFLKSSPNLLKIWPLTTVEFEPNVLHLKYHSDFQCHEWENVKVQLIDYLNNQTFIKVNDIKLTLDEEINNYQKKILVNDQTTINNYNENLQNKIDEKKQKNYKYPIRMTDPITSINELGFNDKNKIISGKIFNIRIRKLKNNISLVSYYLADETSALLVKEYIKTSDGPKLKIGDYVKMMIDIDVSNNFDGHEYLFGKLKKFELLDKPKINNEDGLSNHRIELCLHTKMSSYDGIIDLNGLKEKLISLKHTHFAITDRYNVQNYPDIAKTFNNSGITPIYGVELEKLPTIIPAVLNPIDTSLNSCEYVVFDLETTGLHPIFDDIIEFGAVIVKNNQIIAKEQFFIKPNCQLSTKISNLTNIYETDLENAIDQKSGLEKIVNFIGDRVLVAHNGINFDFNFINIKLIQYGFPPLKNCLIDSMVISRAINEYKAHNLEMLAKKLHLNYNADEAHRADYDAQLLAEVWMQFLQILSQWECKTIAEINPKIQTDRLRQSTRGDFVVVYAKNQQGIKNIYELVSKSHSIGFFNRPTITWDDILMFRDNLITTNLAIESDVINLAIDGSDLELEECISKYDFISLCSSLGYYHEISNENITKEQYEQSVVRIIDLCAKLNKKVVAVSNAYYLDETDKKFHDLYVTMPTLNKKPHRFFKFRTGPICYLRNTNQMLEEWHFLNNHELVEAIVIKNGQDIISLIEPNITPIQKKLYPPKIVGVDEKVKTTVYSNAHKRYGEKLPEIVEQRITKELDSIINHGYAVVYWISHLLVQESINDGYVVGSRGSVGSSLVATFLDITDVNPLPPHYLCNNCCYSDFDVPENIEDGYDLEPKQCPNCQKMMQGDGHNILFEVFLGFYGDKVPDIDLNFSGIYQNKAHNFIKKMFGDKYTYRAGTISTIAEKTSFANTKNYFQEINKEMNPAEIEEYAVKCVDVKRTTGQHPGGIIVVPDDMSIFDFTPYNYPADDKTQDWFTTHFAFEHIHDNLLKFDILGHDNPTVLRMLKDLTGIDEKDIPHYDLKTLSLFSSINELNIDTSIMIKEKTGAISIPEFGTKFVREMLIDTKPISFADLIRISGLSHGTDVWVDNAKELIKTGLHLNQIIACRDDIMSYLINHGVDAKTAFNVMEDVRKGKQIKPTDIEILEKNHVPKWYIDSCNKIKYMFPKAHATAYVMHAWKFAWYKLNYPLEYYASYFSIRTTVFDVQKMCEGIESIKEDYERINDLIKQNRDVTTKEKDLLPIYEVAIEMISRGFSFKMININESDATNFLIDYKSNALICPFKVLDGLGDSVASSIINARNDHNFASKEDFINRTKVSKQHIQLMTKLKIIDDLNETSQIGLFEI